MSRYPEISERKISVIGVYIAWRGEDITLPVAKFLTFWSRKSTGGEIAAENGCLATISELALAARAPGTGQFFQSVPGFLTWSICAPIGTGYRCQAATDKKYPRGNSMGSAWRD